MTATVLVLDNDFALRELMAMALSTQGLEVVCAGTAAEAEEALEGGAVDLLLLDLNLAGGECGVRQVRQWTDAGCLPPFYVVTGTPDDPRLEGVEETAGFLGIVAKPFSLLDLVQEVGERARVIRERRAAGQIAEESADLGEAAC